jgi:tetratricopeptide (TPR) repeat protein
MPLPALPPDATQPAQKVILRFQRGEISVSLADGTLEGVEAALKSLTGEEAKSTAKALTKLAEAFEEVRQYQAASRVYGAVTDVVKLFDSKLNLALALSNQALALKRSGDFKNAELIYRKAVDLATDPFDNSTFEAARVAVLANVLFNLGIVCFEGGKLDESLRVADWCYALVEGDSQPRAQTIAEQCRILRDRITRARFPGPPAASLKVIEEKLGDTDSN